MLVMFPAGGLNKRASFRQDAPYTTPDCNNVRPTETIENRTRGGSRPGLESPFSGNPGSSFRFLSPMVLALPGDVAPFSKTMLVTSASGNLYSENVSYSTLNIVTSDLTVRDDVSLTAAQNGQKLYIADYGDLRAEGTNGVVSGSELDSASYADWTTLGIDTDTDVVVLSEVGGSTVADTYMIASVAAGAITLNSAPGDGSGNTFRIERGPKVYDPDAGTLTLLTATAGQVPTGCPLICRYNGRIFLAGAQIAPHVWYCSKQNDEQGWDYSLTGSQRAVAGTNSDVGTPGKAMTAMFTHSDDYLIMASKDEIYRMRGDPAFGGILGRLSSLIGIVDMNAWCIGPAGELIFLSLDGIYVLPPGGDSMPFSMSREKLPEELLNVDATVTIVSMEYDVDKRGVHIYLTPTVAGSPTHWWLDWTQKTFWPVTLPSTMEPTACCTYQSTEIGDSGVLLGGRDGTIRRYDDSAQDDDGTNFSSYIDIGPIPMAQDGTTGTLVSLDANMAESSGDVAWSVHPALTFEAATGASSTDSGTWVAGLNARVRAIGRGQAYMLKIAGTPGSKWGMENVSAIVRTSGKKRIA